MTRRRIRFLKQVSVALGAGLLFGSLTCVRTVADTVGTGLSLGGATGVLGPNSEAASVLGASLDLLADILHFAPAVN
jgi:hypothetical protein